MDDILNSLGLGSPAGSTDPLLSSADLTSSSDLSSPVSNSGNGSGINFGSFFSGLANFGTTAANAYATIAGTKTNQTAANAAAANAAANSTLTATLSKWLPIGLIGGGVIFLILLLRGGGRKRN